MLQNDTENIHIDRFIFCCIHKFEVKTGNGPYLKQLFFIFE
jgi:hypothetical protein